MMAGFQDRLLSELKKILPPGMKVRVRAPPEGKYSVWIGGSVLASLGTHEGMWITRDMYDEYGPGVVFRRGSPG